MIELDDDRCGRNRKRNMLWDICMNKYTGRSCMKMQLLNDTGAPSIRGELVKPSEATDYAFILTVADDQEIIGAVYEDGIADGELCWVITHGSAQVLLKDATASTHGYWVKTHDVAGRADATLAAPPFGGVAQLDIHMQEIGHCIEGDGTNAGTDVLAEIIMHFN